jgi:hypothetical protein
MSSCLEGVTSRYVWEKAHGSSFIVSLTSVKSSAIPMVAELTLLRPQPMLVVMPSPNYTAWLNSRCLKIVSLTSPALSKMRSILLMVRLFPSGEIITLSVTVL